MYQGDDFKKCNHTPTPSMGLESCGQRKKTQLKILSHVAARTTNNFNRGEHQAKVNFITCGKMLEGYYVTYT